MGDITSFWSIPPKELLSALDSRIDGLDEQEALKRRKNGPSEARGQSEWLVDLMLFIGQFKSPLMLILIVAVILASVLGEFTNSLIILWILLISGLLSFWQERNANRALQKLKALVQVYSTVVRNGKERDVPAAEVVAGDIVSLNAGDIIPGDARLIESNDLHVNEAMLTGESFPAEKEPCSLPKDTPLNKRKNCVFRGTSVVNGTAKIVIVYTAQQTEFGKISVELERHPSENAFERGVRKFGYMIMRITVLLSFLILTVNLFAGRPVEEPILFALALAVGMAPELLPAIVTIMLAAGAKRMAGRGVIVKKLASIQNLGAINVFCCDKTGTLTEGSVAVQESVDGEGNVWDRVKLFACLNARFETGFTNPVDEALRNLLDVSTEAYTKLDEVPYDFIRKRLSIAIVFDTQRVLITKGSLKTILDICETASFADGRTASLKDVRQQIFATHERFSKQGLRTIGICYKDIQADQAISKEDECNMTFIGFVVLADPMKPGVAEAVQRMRTSGIVLKLITGDNQLVAAFVGEKIGLKSDRVLTGSDLQRMSDEALKINVNGIDIFAETEPHQKERIISAIQKAGNIVGYIGDGINDASALKTADVGISVDTAVDVAKETAAIVLLQRDLEVLHDGVEEGRKTFINTLKYIFITTSANFGNMFSLAATSLFLPFLPLLPKQILLLNLLTDVPAMALPSDRVDSELLARPQRWDSKLIERFMIVFGVESSLFDLLTFGVLLSFFHVNITLFQTGWFLESAITEILILLVVRTRRPFFRSRPGRYLLFASVFVGVLALLLSLFPFSEFMGFTPLPWVVISGVAVIAVTYALVAEFTKRMFFRTRRFQ